MLNCRLCSTKWFNIVENVMERKEQNFSKYHLNHFLDLYETFD